MYKQYLTSTLLEFTVKYVDNLVQNYDESQTRDS